MQYRTIAIITYDCELAKKMAKEAWEKNKSWCIASTNNIYDYDVKTYMSKEDNKLVLITTPDKIKTKKVNHFISFCEKYKVLPIFITHADNYADDFCHVMHSNIGEIFTNSFEYIHHDNDTESYSYAVDELLRCLW